MIEKIKLPKEYEFLTDKYFLSDFFKKNDFFSGNEVKIKEIKENSIVMDKMLKIFINYKILVNAREKEVYAIRRFGGTKIEEFKILKYFLEDFPQNNFLLPKPFFYFKKEKFLLYEGVDGKSLKFFKEDNCLLLLKNKISSLVNLVTAIQKSRPPAKKYNIRNDYIKAKKFEKEFLKFLPSSKKIIKETISQIFKEKEFYYKIPFSFIHNDLTLGNIIWEKSSDSFGLIDFSQSCYYDPLADVGTFLAQLDYLNFLTKKEQFIKGLQAEFVKKYFNLSQKDFSSKRLFLHRAWANLQNAIFILGAQSKKQNLQGCLWFLKLANNLLNNAKN